MAFIQQWGTISQDENGDIKISGFKVNGEGARINSRQHALQILVGLIIEKLQEEIDKPGEIRELYINGEFIPDWDKVTKSMPGKLYGEATPDIPKKSD